MTYSDPDLNVFVRSDGTCKVCGRAGGGEFYNMTDALIYAGTIAGAKIHLPAGTFDMTARIPLATGITLYGEGDTNTIFNWLSSSSHGFVPADGTVVEDDFGETGPPIKYIVTLVGGTYYAKTPAGVTLTSGPSAATVINYALTHLTAGRLAKETVLVQCDATLSACIYLQNYSTLQLGATNTLTNNIAGAMLKSVNMAHFELCGGHWSNGTMTQGQQMSIYQCDDFYIHDMEIYGDTTLGPRNGTLLLTNATHALIENNTIHDNYETSFNNPPAGNNAIYLSNICSNVRVTGNTIYNIGYTAITNIVNDGQVGFSENLRFDHNNISECYRSGIGLYPGVSTPQGAMGLRSTIIEDNVVTDVYGIGCYCQGLVQGQGDTYDVIIRNNTISSTGKYTQTSGIQLDGNLLGISHANQCYGNTLTNLSCNQGAIRFLNSYYAIVHDNTITLRGNTIGFYLQGAGYCNIYDNTVTSPMYGVEIMPYVDAAPMDSSSYNIINGNTINSPKDGYACVYIGPTDSGYTQTANQIINNIFHDLGTATDIIDNGTGTIKSGNVIT